MIILRRVLLIMLTIIPSLKCELEVFLNLLKTVSEDSTDCTQAITETGVYTFQHHPRLTSSHCEIKVVVPNDTVMAFVRPSKKTCESTSSASISEMCNTARQEGQMTVGVHNIRFEATESVDLEVLFMPVMTVECDEYVKDLVTSVSNIFILKNTHKKAERCVLRLPPSVTVELLDYRKKVRSKPCCPDIFIASSTQDGSSVQYSDNVNACLVDDESDYKFHSRCKDTYLYFRNAKKKDTLMLRVTARHKVFLNDCIPSPLPTVEQMNYVCMKNPYHDLY